MAQLNSLKTNLFDCSIDECIKRIHDIRISRQIAPPTRVVATRSIKAKEIKKFESALSQLTKEQLRKMIGEIDGEE